MSRELDENRRGVSVISFIGISAVVAAGIVMILGLLCLPRTAHAQCTPLTSHVCRPETSMPHNYSFAQGINYWAVVGVIPTSPDDKDIWMYPACGSGTPLAISTGTDGIDFVVGDFNHTAPGTYYPTATYGSASAFYNVYWRNGGAIFPVSYATFGWLGGSGAGCNMMQIYDVFLEQGREYRFSFDTEFSGTSANAALFRNPSASAYWAGRSSSVLEISITEQANYTAPVTDWYGLVVFPKWNLASAEGFSVNVERLDDCITLSPGVCVNNKLYTAAVGPANDYTFTQQENHWTVVAVLPDTLDQKALLLGGGCDRDYGIIREPFPGVGETQFIVGDFNHNWTPGQFYARAEGGAADLDYSIQWDSGADIFPVPGEVIGFMIGLDSGSECVKVWDIYLEAGKQYEFYFYEFGQKNPHLALFRNPGTLDYWAGRGASEWELSTIGGYVYTAPATDWYGLVVFADERKSHWSSYHIQVEELNDCEPLTSMVCETRSGWPRDFYFTRATPYWAAAALAPIPGDIRGFGVYPQCDGKGGYLAFAEASNTRVIVGDFNHNPLGTYYPRAIIGDYGAPYTVACDTGNDVFPLGIVVEGTIGGTTGDCGLVRIWDVMLNAGSTYQIGFTNGGPADPRLCLFRNPGNGTYWADRSAAEWECAEPVTFTYTAPASDWYGLAVFPNVRGKNGSYTIRISDTAATGIEPEPSVPARFALYQNTPNPFNPATTIRYDVPAGGGRVTLRVFDVSGRVVKTLVDGVESPGQKALQWDGTNADGEHVSTGVYFCRMTAGSFTAMTKLVLLQ